MTELLLTLTALEPLAITSGSAESMAHACLGYVPGNMILGALASNWVRLHRGSRPDDNPAFRRLFLDGDVSFGHALPVCEGEISVPVPLSYKRVKNHPDLPGEGENFHEGKGIVFNVLATNPEDRDALKKLWQECHPGSKERPKPKKMPEAFMNPQSLHLAAEKKVWNMHVALARQRSAVHEQLFGYSALARGTRLRSLILCRAEKAAKDLRDLLSHIQNISVGHARSAGYGLVEIACQWEAGSKAKKSQKREHVLFLDSQYLPFPSWENPLDNFRENLGRKFGQKPEILRQYVDFQEIQGFNGLWKLPRDSRLAMRMGSVIRVSFPEPVEMPSFFELGAGMPEGYGRVLANPQFLEKARPDIAKNSAAISGGGSGKAAPAPSENNLPVWTLLRQRALARIREERVLQWLDSEKWQKFLESACKLSRPTASQRNNLRDANEEKFEKMLYKTPGDQWKRAVCYCPFTNRRDHLDQIMLSLLTCAEDLRLPDDLPGAPSPHEAGVFALDAHKLFVRQLVSLWNKKASSGEK